jgi:Mce-associated membrane protein
MAANPRKPPRPAGPRGKIRVAGSGPSTGKVSGAADADETTVDPDETTAAAPATSDEAVTAEAATDETVSLAKPDQDAASKPASPKKAAKKAGAKKAGLTKAGAKTADEKQPAGPRNPKAPAPFLTWRKVAVVAAVAVVIGIFAVVAALKPGASAQSNVAFINSAETSALKAQAGDRICAVLSIDPTKFDDWANNAKVGLTGQALTEFNEYQATSKDLAAQSGQGAECKVDLVAVSNMDSENATVIATLVISTTQQGVAVLSGPGQARTELGLQKVDGQWLISRISDF